MNLHEETHPNRLQKLQGPADLLVLWMQAVVEASDGQHDDALACDVLEGSGDGNRASFTDQVRLHGKHYETQVRCHSDAQLLLSILLTEVFFKARIHTHSKQAQSMRSIEKQHYLL